MKALLSSVILFFSVVSYADEDQILQVNVTDPGFIVTLPANPTTGYQWTVGAYDKNLLTLGSSNFEKPKTNLIGAGGQMHYTFKLFKGKNYPDSTEIQFTYARSWDKKSAIMKVVKVNFIK